MKLCKDCKHYVAGNTRFDDRCLRTLWTGYTTHREPVRGLPATNNEPSDRNCHRDRLTGQCGYEAVYFEPHTR